MTKHYKNHLWGLSHPPGLGSYQWLKNEQKNILQKAALAISDHTTYRQGSTEGGGRFSWNVIG